MYIFVLFSLFHFILVYFIYQPLSDIELIEGQTARLEYKLSNNRYTVWFLKDNKCIPETRFITKSVAGRSKKLKFTNIALNDTGTYCLKVAGIMSNQIKIIVYRMLYVFFIT